MIIKSGTDNIIEPSSQIIADIQIGSHNYIGKNVLITSFTNDNPGPVSIGDCNYIHDNTRILIGTEGVSIGDWNVFHNNMLVMGDLRLEIGHNCWFGQNTILDSTGGLHIGNGVRVGMYSQIWTHVASGELIEGCTLFAKRKTVIEDDVWLVGSCVVGSGLTLKYRSICLIGSLLTKDTEPTKVYGGAPAKLIESMDPWKPVSLNEKFEMMHQWSVQFVEHSNENVDLVFDPEKHFIKIIHNDRRESLYIGTEIKNIKLDNSITYFNLQDKTYTKRLTHLERKFYKFIYGHKARFLPKK